MSTTGVSNKEHKAGVSFSNQTVLSKDRCEAEVTENAVTWVAGVIRRWRPWFNIHLHCEVVLTELWSKGGAENQSRP